MVIFITFSVYLIGCLNPAFGSNVKMSESDPEICLLKSKRKSPVIRCKAFYIVTVYMVFGRGTRQKVRRALSCGSIGSMSESYPEICLRRGTRLPCLLDTVRQAVCQADRSEGKVRAILWRAPICELMSFLASPQNFLRSESCDNFPCQ